MNKRKLIYVIYPVATIFLIIATGYITYIHLYKKYKTITVFIHGTFMPELAIFNPYKTYTQTLTNEDLYARSLEKLRCNPETYQDSLTLETGLHKIPRNILECYQNQDLAEHYSKIGAYQLVGAYDSIYKTFKSKSQSYYTFGFNGLLSSQHRQDSAKLLYDSLIKLLKKYSDKNVVLDINLICFSHGGNVALYLAKYENQYNQNLNIDNLILLGTPIQFETANYAQSNIFNRVLNIYSEADYIQTKDSISTANSISHQKLYDLIEHNNSKNDTIHNKIIDIRLLAGQDKKVFGHLHLWGLAKYGYSSYWWKSDHTKKIVEALDPLPIVTLVPGFISIIKSLENNIKTQNKNIDISLNLINNNEFVIQALEYDTTKLLAQTRDISKPLYRAKRYAIESWIPYGCQSQMLKTTRAFWETLKNAFI